MLTTQVPRLPTFALSISIRAYRDFGLAFGWEPAGHGRVLEIPGVLLAEVAPAGLLDVLLVEGLVEVLEDVLPEPVVELVPCVVPGVVVLVLPVEVPEGEVVVLVEGLVVLVPG